MTSSGTFEELARVLAEAGAARSCEAQASALDARAMLEPALRAEALHRAARGLRAAARIHGRLSPSHAVAPFRPVGFRGAIAAGHLALAAGRAAEAELVGEGAAEAAPRSPAGLRLVGEALFAQGRFQLAVRALRGALAADLDDAFTRVLHAEALWFAGERVAARCALATLRAGGRVDPLVGPLEDAMRSGALEAAGRTRCG